MPQPRRTAKSLVEINPSSVSAQDTARVWATFLNKLEIQRVELDAAQFTNRHEDDDNAPGLPPKIENGEFVMKEGQPVMWTYGDRRTWLGGEIARVWNQIDALELRDRVTAILEDYRANN